MFAEIIEGDCLGILRALPYPCFDSIVTDPPAGISFMGKEWDSNKGGRREWVAWLTQIMAECLRVLRPGGHALVWALPRTSHWTATAIEDAGFEVRDVIMHIFGSGFPKSLDVSKAIDKAAGAEREIIECRLGPKPGTHGGSGKYGHGEERKISAPATEAAKEWEGWGTALKPAAEHWILARKPLGEKTVAANVLKHGTGAINIDGCRIGTETITTVNTPGIDKFKTKYSGSPIPKIGNTEHVGRWPANVILDEAAAEVLDSQTAGTRAAKPSATGTAFKPVGLFPIDNPEPASYPDSGGASRFFYVAKPSTKERNAGLDDFPKKVSDDWPQSLDGGDRRGASPRANTHPTVKPIALMRYLCRLITPPNGIILDPFTGSGTTGCAALLEGFGFVGIEADPEHVATAKARIAHWASTVEEAA